MIYIDLFSGIVGFALGAYWAGMKFDKHYFSEVDKDAVELYRKRCPDAIPLGDITKVDWKALTYTDRTRELQPEGCQQEERERIGDGDQTEYIITGGFPCQDLSVAGKGAGLEGSQSGLWTAMFEAIRILRPRYVIIENVGAIVGWFPRGLAGFSPDRPPNINGDRWSVDIEQYQAIEPVLDDLNSIGYDAEWQDIRAEDMGAPHKRERIWIVAYPGNGANNAFQRSSRKTASIQSEYRQAGCTGMFSGTSDEISDSDRKHGNNAGHGTSEICWERSEQAEVQRCEEVPNSESPRNRRQHGECGYQNKQHSEKNRAKVRSQPYNSCESIRERDVPNPTKPGLERQKPESKLSRGKPGLPAECNRSRPGKWLPEPCMGVLVDGLPAGLDRFEGRLSNKSYKKAAQIKGIGNSIVPQIAELLFRQIKDLI